MMNSREFEIQLYPLKKAAQLLQISAITLRRLVNARKIQHTWIGGKIMITKEGLQAYIKEMTVEKSPYS